MKRSAFATLVGISRPMISKYAAVGLIAEENGEVDAAESLALLEGRLDEDKRRAALQKLEGASPSKVARPPSAKVLKDEVDLQLKRLRYSREAGELVSADEVDQASRQAVAAMREAFGNRRRAMAETICLQFDLAPDKASAMARLIAREFEATLGVFGQEMATLAGQPATPSARAEAGLATTA